MASAFATLHHVSGGRAHLGIGWGDTALELIGNKPPSSSGFGALLEELQAYLRGDPVDVVGFRAASPGCRSKGNPRFRSTYSALDRA